MLNSQLLDVAIGMAFTYLALALICSGIIEWIAQIRNSRGRRLEDWLRGVLLGTNITRLLLSRKALVQVARFWRGNAPNSPTSVGMPTIGLLQVAP